MDEHRQTSRRAILRRAVMLTGATLVGINFAENVAFAQQKATKSAMKYQDSPSGDKRCSDCQQFKPPAACAIVEGTIKPEGYCIAWVKKA